MKFTKRFPFVEKSAISPATVSDDKLIDVDGLKDKLAKVLKKNNKAQLRNVLMIMGGAMAATAGIAADVAFLGGIGTVTVLSGLVFDQRLGKQGRDIQDAILRLDEKIEALRSQGNKPDVAPAILALDQLIDSFDKAKKTASPHAKTDLENLQQQALTVRARIANDDGKQGPAKAQI